MLPFEPLRTALKGGGLSDVNWLPDHELLLATTRGLLIANMRLSSVTPVSQDATGRAFKLHQLPDGKSLVNAEHGWFVFNPSTRKIASAGDAKSGMIEATHQLPTGGVLISTEQGWVLLDLNTHKVVPVGAAYTGSVVRMHDLPSGDVLIAAQNGLFRFDAKAREVVSVDPTNGVLVSEPSRFLTLSDGGTLIGARNGLFKFDTAVSELQFPDGVDSNWINRLDPLPNGGALIVASGRLFRFEAKTHQIFMAATGKVGGVFHVVHLSDGNLLLSTGQGLLLFDVARGEAIPASKADVGKTFEIHPLPGDQWLIYSEKGWVRFDAKSLGLMPAGTLVTKRPRSIVPLSKGALLIGTDLGLFRFDASSGEVVRVNGAVETGAIGDLRATAYDGAIVGAERGWFRFDAQSRAVVPMGLERSSSQRLRAQSGQALIVTSGADLFLVPPTPLRSAKVEPLSKFNEWVVQTDAREIRMKLLHPCAQVAANIDLSLRTYPRSEPSSVQVSPIRYADGSRPEAGVAELAAVAKFDRPGDWILEVRQGEAIVGKPLALTLAGPTILDQILLAWKWVLLAIGATYFILFFVLLWLSHRSLAALRMLIDPAWGAKLLTWPFFLLRHFTRVQRWVFEPWFQAVRTSNNGRVSNYIDPPVRSLMGDTKVASALLGTLHTTPRIWLQGGIGMGKSTVFSAWEKAYFDDGTRVTLSEAASDHGFILLTLSVRHYAIINPPELNNPESWVIEAVRKRFEEFGVVLEESSTIKAMLRSGHFAIALDGTNEADRSDSIIAFARQYPQVKMIATSQSPEPEGWTLWRLPTDIAELRSELLKNWLGDTAGSALEKRIASHPSVMITSGYDLRLVADLTRAAPESTELPAGRIGLYRAILSRAVTGEGTTLDLFVLRRLAAKLIVEGRREFSLDEGRSLGDGVAEILSSTGVRAVRRRGVSWEFRHDQMRAFLAACSLADDAATLPQMISRIEEQKLFGLRREDQDALWSFLAELVSDGDVQALWVYAQHDPGRRGLLQGALQVIADRRGVVLTRPSTSDHTANLGLLTLPQLICDQRKADELGPSC